MKQRLAGPGPPAGAHPRRRPPAAISALITVAVRPSASTPRPGQGPPFFDRITQNGPFVGVTRLVVPIPLVLPLTVGVVAGDTIVGAALIPADPGTLLSGDQIAVGEPVPRSLLVAAYVTVSMLGPSALGLFISTLTEVPVGAIAATITLSVASRLLDCLAQLSRLHRWLQSHYWLSLADLLRQPILWTSFRDNALLGPGYVAVPGGVAYGRFVTKDVLA